jgi:D-3-phosphoglycerate dehydrogenase
MPTVLIAPSTLRTVEGPFRDALTGAGLDLVFPARPAQMSEDELLERLTGVDYALAGSEPYTRRVLDARPQLKVIARTGVGYDAVDVVAATDHGIPVTVAPGNADAVAEHAFGLMLALAKQIIPQHNSIQKGGWPRASTFPVRGKTLGIAGLGRIGKATALRGLAFGMKVIAYEPFPDTAFVERHGVGLVTLDKLFEESDFISLHLPLTSESKQFVDRRLLGRMKPSAYLVNTSRGGVIHEADLLAALRERRIAGAGLDVLVDEPPAADNPLTKLDNVVLTAHTAGIDTRARDDMGLMAAQAIVMLHRGEWPEAWVVNPAVRPAWEAKRG